MNALRENVAKNFALAVSLLIVSALGAGCGKSAPTTSPTSTTPDSITETFAGTLPVGGSKFYAFSTAIAGTVTATLTNIGGDGVPSSVMVNLGIGTLSGFTCSASSTAVQSPRHSRSTMLRWPRAVAIPLRRQLRIGQTGATPGN